MLTVLRPGHVCQTVLHEETDRYDEAEAAYRKTIELKPDYAWAWGKLGQLLHEEVQALRRSRVGLPEGH